jgi:hypothetical protein
MWEKDFKVLCELADLVEGDTDRMIQNCGTDEKLVRMMVGLYNGRAKPSEVIGSLKRRYLRSMVLAKISRDERP